MEPDGKSGKKSIAVVGAGYWGRNLVRNVAQNPEAGLAAVCDTSEQVRAECQEHYPSTVVYGDLSQMLEEVKPDGVIVATPAALHHEHAEMALAAGAGVLIEKPFTVTVDEAQNLVRIAESKGLILMAGHTFLYNNIVREAKRRVDSGELGEIYYVYCRRLNLGLERPDTDVVWDLAPHDISICDYLLGECPTEVSATGFCCLPGRSAAHVAFLSLRYPSGRRAHVHVSWLDPNKVRQTVVVGSKKMLIYDDADPTKHIQIYDKRLESDFKADFTDFADFLSRVRAGDLVIPTIRMREPLGAEVAHFIECLQTGRSPLSNGLNGLEVARILTAVSDSMRADGAPVHVP